MAALLCAAAWGQAPTYSAAGVVNASDNSTGPFAPNSVVSLYGTNLSFNNAIAIFTTSVPYQLGGVSVLVDNVPAALLYVSPGQINFIVPSTEIAGTSKVQVVRQSVAGPAISITLVSAAPALFSTDGIYALAQDYQNNYALVTTASPAHAGDTIVLYCLGLGATQPNPGLYELSPTAANVVNAITVLLNGSAIDHGLIGYAGATPQSAGLYQINFAIPQGVTGDVEVRVSSAGQTSAPGLKLAVR